MNRLLVLTDRRLARRPLVQVIAEAVAGGARAVLLRERDLPQPERVALARDLAAVLAPVGGRLLWADGPGPAPDCCAGSHQRSRATGAPQPARLSGRSCHTRAEVLAAAADGVGYLTVSPVLPSVSKPGYGPVLGPSGLARLTAGVAVPVLALGGVSEPGHVRACRDAGAYGVAVLGAVMTAPEPGRLVADLVRACGPDPAAAGPAAAGSETSPPPAPRSAAGLSTDPCCGVT